MGKGLWPALWMLPSSGSWPPELDIVEVIGHQPNVAYMNVHWGVWPDKKNKGALYIGPDFSAGYHVFALEWNEEELVWLIDGQERFRTKAYVPHEPFYLILNTAVGGDWPGSPNSATVFPQYHEIDYVRVYAKEVPGTYFLNAAVENGTLDVVPKQERYNAGARVVVQAKPAIGYEFDRWSGDLNESKNPAEITMDKHREITAIFRKKKSPPQLVSRGSRVLASSVESDAFAAGNVVDGDRNTRWSSEFSGPQWIQIDLGRRYAVEAVRLVWEVAFARTYEIQNSDDGKTWRTVYTQNAGMGGTEEITNLDVDARYIALYCTQRAAQFGYSLWEIEVFGKEVPSQ
jgi:hypothetical protein